jgi:hypothetical protein
VLDDRAQDEAADAAETVDGDAKSHDGTFLIVGCGQRFSPPFFSLKACKSSFNWAAKADGIANVRRR